MKYFTPELWASWSERDYTPPPPEKDPFRLYQAELETLRERIDETAFHFFTEADVHDGELLDYTIKDGSRPAPLGQPGREWESLRNYPVTVTLRVLDAYDKLLWTLKYSNVRKVSVSYATEEEPWSGSGFGDWGYHELLDAGDGFLRHEVLFASDSTLLVEFKSIVVSSQPARENAQPDS